MNVLTENGQQVGRWIEDRAGAVDRYDNRKAIGKVTLAANGGKE